MDTEQRFIDLETKILFQEKIIEELNEALRLQQDQLTKLEKSFERFTAQMQASAENEIRPNEKPPHY